MPSHDDLPRSALPMPDRPRPGLTTYDARDPETSFAPITPLRPPADAPNVLVILLDDVGFGASSVFGGPVDTPVAQRLADGGLRYTRFHTTALCSPTRQALLTGRNHHSVGMGAITELATAAPGYNTIRPNTKATLAETLRLNGYATAQIGKCHETPVWETSPVGPFDRWPTGSGFEYFYGFVGGETNQYYPTLYQGTTAVEPERTPEQGYHLTEDLADHGVDWIRRQHALQPDRPFFLYFAPGATHAPHHAPEEWSDRYAGRFDAGWDALREEIFERQKQLGVIPADARLTAFNPEIPHWDEMPDDLKPVLARQMEVYAGFLAHTDAQIGRLVQGLDDLELLDNTLIYYIIGDNGASAEGSVQGSFNEAIGFNGLGVLETPDFLRAKAAEFGTPSAYNHYAVGSAHAMCTPYQWTKQVASHWGGTRNGTIVHWPARITGRGELREQFAHVIDVAPTILEAARLPEPSTVHGVTQAPIEGVSMGYSFDDATAPERHQTQYFEIAGNRGIYHRGWTAVTKHRTPWQLLGAELAAFDDDVWELYGPGDWTQSRDLAAEQPEMLHRLQRLWLIEATKHGVLPLDDRAAERFNPDLAGHSSPGGTPRRCSRAWATSTRVLSSTSRTRATPSPHRWWSRRQGPRASSCPRAAWPAAGASTAATVGCATATTWRACSTSTSGPATASGRRRPAAAPSRRRAPAPSCANTPSTTWTSKDHHSCAIRASCCSGDHRWNHRRGVSRRDRAYPRARAQLWIDRHPDRPLRHHQPQSTTRKRPALRPRAGGADGLRRRAVPHHQARRGPGRLARDRLVGERGRRRWDLRCRHRAVHGRRVPAGHRSRRGAGVLGRRLAGLQLRGLRVCRLDRDRRSSRAQAPGAAAVDGMDRCPGRADQPCRSVRRAGGNRCVLSARLVRPGRRSDLRRVATRHLLGGLAIDPPSSHDRLTTVTRSRAHAGAGRRARRHVTTDPDPRRTEATACARRTASASSQPVPPRLSAHGENR